MRKISNSVPMSTQLLEKYEIPEKDIRFTKVKIWLMHTGLNENGSVFTKEVVNKAIPTLANTPIMGAITSDYFGDKDFKGHESAIEVSEDGEVKFVNKTIPFGVIPEFNNAKWETRLGDDMIEREYLTVEGLLWNKWDDAIDIIYGKHGVTGQSMELSEDYSGIVNGDTFEFTHFQFYGACLLGDNVEPAMNNSTVEIKFAKNTKEFIEDKVNLFTKLTFNKEGGNDQVSNKEETNFEEVKEEAVSAEVTEEEKQEPEVEKEAPKRKRATRKKKEEPAVEEEKEEVAAEEQPVVEKITVEEQSIDDVAKIREEKRKEQEELPNPVDLITVAGEGYSVQDIENLIAERNEFQVKYETLAKEVHEEKVEALFNKYSKALSSEEISELKEKAQNFSVEELETQICAVIGKNTFSNKNFSKEEKQEVKFSKVNTLVTNKPANKLDEILNNLKK